MFSLKKKIGPYYRVKRKMKEQCVCYHCYSFFDTPCIKKEGGSRTNCCSVGADSEALKD